MEFLFSFSMNRDEQYMQHCLCLALQGLGNVAPNPMVGCVIVHENKIIGEGYHQQYGAPHAEVNAIRSVSDESLLKNSTLYVNLEPCSHFGKTPPCANLIVSKHLRKVVIGSNDPNPQVAGRGIQLLRENGIEVVTEILKPEADFLNRRFFTFHTHQRPYLILKWAQSKDGFLAPASHQPYWLTNEASKKLVHKWRTEEQAIMVGTNTVIKDDPELTARLWTGKNPLRVTIDRELTLPDSKKIVNRSAPTLVFNQRRNYKNETTEYIKIDFSGNILSTILRELHQRNILSVIVEGGAALLNSFIEEKQWDEARIFTTNHLFETGLPAPIIRGTTLSEIAIEHDKLRILLNKPPLQD